MVARERPIYKQLKLWVDNYGSAGITDQKAVQTFMECETNEAVKMLQNELIGISHGNFEQNAMDKLVRAQRRINYGSYQEWAKLMLLWIAECNR